MSFAQCQIYGNLTRDPETRTTAGGLTVANFAVAVNRTRTKDGEKVEEVTFIDCEAWGRTAETIAEYLVKGRPVMIRGRLRQDAWEDKNTGARRSKLVVVLDGFDFVGKKDDHQAAQGQAAASKSKDADFDDIPF